MIKIKKLVLLVFCVFVSLENLHAASFDKYASKLLKFEGTGFGIDKPTWGNRDFSKQEALAIHREKYWNRFHGDLFASQEVAEVFIDHLINAGVGQDSENIKAFEAIIGEKQDGILSISDIKKANSFIFPEQIVNPFVRYRILYYKTRKNADKFTGWFTRALSFLMKNGVEDFHLDEISLPEKLEEHYAYLSTRKSSVE